MRHMIIGAGNLGHDLFMEAKTMKDVEPVLFSLSKGLDVTDLKTVLETVSIVNPDFIWYCVGSTVVESKFGSPHYDNAVQKNLNIPVALASKLPEHINLVLFSSDACADESRPKTHYAHTMRPRSEYAQQKILMEQMLMQRQRPLTTIVRIGSLYGLHKPLKTFPGRMIQRYGFNDKQVRLPSNVVVPTPTRWLAAMLLRSLEQLCPDSGTTIEHCAPNGGVTVKDWAKFCLRGLRDDYAFEWGKDYFDEERPYLSNLGCTIGSERPIHWYELWKNYFSPEWYVAREWAEAIPVELKHKRRLKLY